ncbi:unnamed protein product [Penicillium salamii]|nr:unnamed protein product [Penicillium salamii]CAG8377660.1 unnamed protein product [Penicillium salamii]
MPVTIQTTDHAPSRWRGDRVSEITTIFKDAYVDPESLLQSSLTKATFDASHISSSFNGFVCAVLEAYNHHHNLILRPQDVWFAILSQLDISIVYDTESDREFSHERKKRVNVLAEEWEGFDYGKTASLMTNQFQHTLEHKWNTDPGEWYTSPLASPTNSDKVVESVLMMGNMRKDCTYAVDRACGIPSVTLLGEREDWVNLMAKAEKIPWTGGGVVKFEDLLQPVLRRFLVSFDDPESDEVQSFWARCAYRHGDRSWATHLTGWITVFCFWDDKGMLPRGKPDDMSEALQLGHEEEDLLGALLGKVELKRIPRGYATVPVKLWGGIKEEQNTMMVAGSVGIIATTSSGQASEENENALLTPTSSSRETPCSLDTIQPLSAWWIYKKK